MLPQNITVTLVEDEPNTHARLCAALKADPHIKLVAAFSAAEPILAWLETHRVDVVLVDLGLPDRPGFEVIQHCKQRWPSTEVMVVTMFGDENNMIRAFEAGASGYLLKDASEEELAEHVQTLHAGGSPMSPIIARRLLSRMGKKSSASATYSSAHAPITAASVTARVARVQVEGLLTDREEQVLQQLARGYSYAELAKVLGVTINTIQTHIRGLYAKLEVHSKAEAISEAKHLGLIAP